MGKKIALIIFWALLVGGVVLTIVRWDAWFVEPVETCDEVIPIHIRTMVMSDLPMYPMHKILVLGDIQDRDMEMAEETRDRLGDIVAREKPDLIVQTGDLFERQNQASWNRVAVAMNDIMDSLPLVVALGNHDYHKGLVHQPDVRIYRAFPYFGTTNVKQPAVAHLVLLKDTLELFILDSNRDLVGLLRQRSWLKTKLQKSEARYKIVVLHHPMRSEVSWWNNLFVRMAFEGLVKEYGVQLVFSGHDHYYAHRDEGYHQIVTHFSKKEYDGNGASGRHYSIVEVVDNTLTVKVFDDTDKVVEKITVK